MGLVRLKFGLAVCVLFLTSELASANRLPKFPRTQATVQPSESLALHPSSTRTKALETHGETTEDQTPKSKEVTNGTTLSALNLGAGHNHTSKSSEIDKTAGTQGKTSDEEGTSAEPQKAADDSQETDSPVRWDGSGVEDPHSEVKEEGAVIVKSRLRPADVLHKAVGHNDTMSAKGLKGSKHHKHNTTELRKKRTKGLDVVITHFDPSRTEQMVDFWLNFLQQKKVRELKPYVFIYCQNEHEDLDEEDFKPILQLGGEVVHLPNIGRESHSYLEHITRMYSDLANHTLFAQDISSDSLPDRFEAMFEEKTGFLPLSLVGHVDCESGQTQDFLPAGLIPQIYSMFAEEICPPVGYTSSFEGQFVVSKRRVTDHSWWIYRKLLDLLGADESHWIHEKHSNAFYKHRDNPMFGHVLERTWSVAFNCFESWREGNCWECIERRGMRDCGPGACQCYD